MGVSVKSSRIARVVGAITALWLLCADPAWAGGGGEDAEGLQAILIELCTFVSPAIPCPQYPTYANTTTSPATPISPLTPIVLELSAFGFGSPDSVRMEDSDCILGGTPFCPQIAVNAINGPAKPASSVAVTLLPPPALPYLTPLAFVSNPSNSTTPLTATQYGNPAANSFFYAAVLEDQSGAPQSLDLFYDYPAGKQPLSLVISLPLATLVKNASTETSVVATLTATCLGPSACTNVKVSIPSLGSATYTPARLGLTFNYYFSSSPNSPSAHPIVEVEVPLLVSTQTDPFYFLGTPLAGCDNGGNLLSGYCNAFSATSPPSGFKLSLNQMIGMAPSAAPQCPSPQPTQPPTYTSTCPSTYPARPTQPLSPTFGFCASFNGSKQPAVAGYLAIGTDATTYVSSPVAPALSGAPYPACPS
jgi:hypothetical protein